MDRRVARRTLLVALVALACASVDSQTPPQPLAVPVPGGTFRMGTSAASIPALKARYGVGFRGVFEDEVPDHAVTIGAFRLDRVEVTNERFERFVRARPEWSRARMPASLHNGHYLEHWTGDAPPAVAAAHPVVFVTWHAAQAFCAWEGGRLPTEAEWEFAARAGRDAEFPWGDEPPTPERTNFRASGLAATRPVGSYPANPLGLQHMAGNVWEFVADEWRAYSPDAQVSPLAGTVPPDPREVQGRRVVRGGSFDASPVNLRTRWRDSHDVRNAVAFVGFRCAYAATAARR